MPTLPDISGKTIVLTGRFTTLTRKQVAAALAQRGAIIGSSVGSGTDLLIAGEKAGSKLAKANKLGITVLSEEDLSAILADGAPAPAPAPAAASGAAAAQQDIADGETVSVQGSGRRPYQLKNVGGVYSCTCPAWCNQSRPIERRTCKHLKAYRGAAAEVDRIGKDNDVTPSTRPPGAKPDAPPVLLAQKWEPGQDPSGWWMSEKLDGVRAWWDGTRFLSRLGNTLHAPDWFIADLPDTPLDGELWIARGAFQRTVSVVRRQDKSDHWRAVRFLIFDAPEQPGPFEDRVAWLRASISAAHAEVVEHVRCDDAAHLARELARVEALSGEGLMIREPGSGYVSGRSSTLLKVKSFHDGEARVLAYRPGAGKHKGRVGALEVVTPGGVRFAVGTGMSDADRESPPATGAVVHYRYQELTDAGVPRFPSFVGERDDFAWPDDATAGTDVPAVSILRDPASRKWQVTAPDGTVTRGLAFKAALAAVDAAVGG